jgi:hypothetical protein
LITSDPMRSFWLADRMRSTVMLIFLLVTSAQLRGTCMVAFAYENLWLFGPTAALSCLVMSVQLRLLAKAPGSLRPSLVEPAVGLATLDPPTGLDEFTDPVAEDPAAVGDVSVVDASAADGVGAVPPLELFEVHALSIASVMHAAVAAVAITLLWRRRCDKAGPVSAAAGVRRRCAPKRGASALPSQANRPGRRAADAC